MSVAAIDPNYFKIASGLFCLLNPFVLIPVFLALTSGMNKGQKMKIAFMTSTSVFIIMLIAIFTGNWVLKLFGITVYDFQIAGGILIMLMSIAMVQAKEQEHRISDKEHRKHLEANEQSTDSNIAVVPLAIPLMAGPASISVGIMDAGDCPFFWPRIILIIMVAGMCVILWISMVLGDKIGRLLGNTGQQILSRVMGLILLALAADFIISGIKHAFNLS